jgi:hypothetical protein
VKNSSISSYLDAITFRSPDQKIRTVIQGAMDAIQMGASLTRKLLFLSSRQGVGLERLDLNDRVTGKIELLRRTLGEQVTISLRLSPTRARSWPTPAMSKMRSSTLRSTRGTPCPIAAGSQSTPTTSHLM